MLYMILGRDIPNSLDARIKVRPEHLARLESLRDTGRLLLAGPIPAVDSPEPGSAGFIGSLIIAEFPSLEAAQEWAAGDPYTVTGVFASVEVQPFKKTLP